MCVCVCVEGVVGALVREGDVVECVAVEVCVCVYERETGRERERETGRERVGGGWRAGARG